MGVGENLAPRGSHRGTEFAPPNISLPVAHQCVSHLEFFLMTGS